MTLKVLFTSLILASVTPAVAGINTNVMPNAAEMSRLPIYCQAKLSGFAGSKASPEASLWQSRIGENWLAFHHYCFGLTSVNRYWGARTAKERSYYLEVALNNFNYMVRAEKPDFSLRAELYSNRGEVFKLMGKPGEAVNDYHHALSINPRIVKPYLQLADLHVAGKTPARALETVTEGLRYLPDSKALQRRYLELGGKKPFPDPIVAKAAEPPPQKSDEPAPPSETAIEKEAAPASSPESVPASTAQPQQTIGSPQNPYCRFCPPE